MQSRERSGERQNSPLRSTHLPCSLRHENSGHRACVRLRSKPIIGRKLHACLGAYSSITADKQCRTHRIIDVNSIRRRQCRRAGPLSPACRPVQSRLVALLMAASSRARRKSVKKLMSLGRPSDFTLRHLLYIHVHAQLSSVRSSSPDAAVAPFGQVLIAAASLLTEGHTLRSCFSVFSCFVASGAERVLLTAQVPVDRAARKMRLRGSRVYRVGLAAYHVFDRLPYSKTVC